MREALLDLDEACAEGDGRPALPAPRRGPVDRGDRGGARVRRRRSSTSPPTGAPTRGGASGACARPARRQRIDFHRPSRGDDPRPRRGDPDRRRPLQGLHPLPPRLERGCRCARRCSARRASSASRRLRRGRAPGAGGADRRHALPRPRAGRRDARGASGMRAFLRDGLGDYDDGHDDLAGDGTSRLSAHLRFGCVSPARAGWSGGARAGAAAEPFVRQLCWRDFHHQVLAAFPSLPRRDYRPRGDRWSRSRAGLRGLARRPHRLPAGRRRDAPAAPPRATCTTARG